MRRRIDTSKLVYMKIKQLFNRFIGTFKYRYEFTPSNAHRVSAHGPLCPPQLFPLFPEKCATLILP